MASEEDGSGSHADRLLEDWVADPEAALREVACTPERLAPLVAATAAPQHAVLDQDAVSFAVCDFHGRIMWADARFAHWTGIADTFPPTLAPGNAPFQVELLDRGAHGPVFIAIVAHNQAQSWALTAQAHDALNAKGAARLLAVVWLGGAREGLVRAAKAFGLTNMEARIAAALAITGEVRSAAAQAKVSYETARVAIKAALAKSGARRQSQLIGLLTRTITAPTGAIDETACLRDLFGLNHREAMLANALAGGLTRDEAARHVGISRAVAKDAFERIFQRIGVSAAAPLGRLVLEARAIWLLARPRSGEIVINHVNHEPLQFIPRPDGTLVAISDFGPKRGRAVFLLHQVTMTRYPSRMLVAALQDHGFRPITIDRPGYGQSDLPLTMTDDPFVDAARDMRLVAESLGLEHVDILTRTGAHVALAFAHLAPKGVGRVVLLSPDPAIPGSKKRQGVLGVIKEIYARYPHLIEPVARFLASRATPERVRINLQRALRDSPADLSAMRDEANLADYQRGVMMLAGGQLAGMIRETQAFANGAPRKPLSDARNWRVFLGAQDVISATQDMARYWDALLPGVEVTEIPDGGRFLHLTHTACVIEALKA